MIVQWTYYKKKLPNIIRRLQLLQLLQWFDRTHTYTVYIDPKILNQIELKMTKIQEPIKYKIYLQEMTTVLSNVGRISHISLHLLLEKLF